MSDVSEPPATEPGPRDEAAGLEPGSAEAQRRRGCALEAAGDLEGAARAYAAALELEPGADPGLRLAGLYLNALHDADRALPHALEAARIRLHSRFSGADGAALLDSLVRDGSSAFRLRHDLQQAEHLLGRGLEFPGLRRARDAMHQALSREGRPSGEPENHPRVRLTPAEAEAVFVFLAACFLHEDPTFEGPCLNPDENWEVVERDYFASRPEIVVIDDFLAEDALRALREFSLASTVWKDEYPHRYLGAFAASGFVSKLHLRIAVELREKLPRILGAHGLQELWGFKYDPRTEKGIDVHADFAVVNLNFWITPDEFNLDPASGGLKIYDVPAPPDWSFDRYNEGGDLIHRFLAEQRASCRTVRHRCNRAVLFNSALFHETDAVHFRDLYEGRRINLTYLFGRQLRAD